MEPRILSKRLAALAAMVRPGARLVDVGTDHAYLPVYLVSKGIVSAALASDIVPGPLERARRHIGEASLNGVITTVLTPGLDGAEAFAPTDIVIAGMGGELVVSIIDAAPFVRSPEIRLILQPMTKQAQLRLYLAENGFEITEERLIPEDGRIYQALCAVCTGKPYGLSPLEAEVGALNLRAGGEELRRLLKQKTVLLEKAISGMKAGNRDTKNEERLLEAMKNVLNTERTVK